MSGVNARLSDLISTASLSGGELIYVVQSGNSRQFALGAKGAALLDDTGRTEALTTLGVSSFMQSVLDDTGATHVRDAIVVDGSIARAKLATTIKPAVAITPEEHGANANGTNDKTALEAAFAAGVAGNTPVRLSDGKTYTFSTISIPAGTVIIGNGTLRSDASLTGSSVTVTVGNNCIIETLKITTPGTETNTDILSIGTNVRIGYLDIRADAQRAGGGIITTGDHVIIDYVKTVKIDRPLHLQNTSLTTQTEGSRIGFLDVESYVRAFRGTFCSFDIGGIRAVTRSANASKSAGHNTVLIVGCSDWSIGDIWSEDAGEHVFRIGGSDGSYQITKNYSIGVITAIRCGGCAFKVNPTLKTTIAGTVAVTSGSAALTGTSTSFTTELFVGSNIRINDTSEIYRVVSITNNTTATLDRNVTTTDASSTLDVMEAAWNGAVKGVIGIDVGDPADAGNEELLRLSHTRQLNIGWALAYTDGDTVSSQYLAQVNDIDGVTIGTLGGENLNSGFINFDGTSDIDVGQFGGDVTNFSVQRIIGTMNGGNNAVAVNTTFNLSKISLNFDSAAGWATNLIRWDAGTLTGLFEVTGRVSGSVTPVYLTVPDSDNFLIDVAYNNSRSQGRPNGSRPGAAVYEVMSGIFAIANAPPTTLYVNATRATAGSGAYGGSIELGRPGSGRRAAAVAAKQMTATAYQCGLSFLVGNPGATSNDAVLEGATLDHTGVFDVIGAYEVDGTQVVTNRVTGWAAATGTATRTTFATSTVTTAQLAERVKALIDDLITHGLIGT